MDWVAALLNLISTGLLAVDKPIPGWSIMIVSSFGYIYLNYQVGLYGLAAGSVAFLFMEVYGLYRALKKRKSNKSNKE